MIPTVPGSEINVSTPQRAAHLDAGALAAPARATLSAIDSRYRGVRETSGAIEGAGAVLGGLAEDMLKVHRANVAADADFRMRAAQQSFLESIRGDQNERDWGERAQQVFQQTREDIYANHSVPPGMKPELENSIKSWGQALQIKTQTLSQVQSINRAEVSIRKSYDEAGRDGDAVGMAHAVALGRSSKLDPTAMDEMEQNIPRSIAMTAIENGLRANPQGTHALLSSGASLPIADQTGKPIVPSKVFSPKELTSLVEKSAIETKKFQTTNFEAMVESDRDPITGYVPEQVIRNKIKSGEIAAIAGENRIAAQNRKIEAKTAKDKASLLSQDHNNAMLLRSRMGDPTNWGDAPEEFAHEIISSAANINNDAIRQSVITDAHKHEASIKKTGQIAERPVERSMYELMSRDLAEQSAMVPIAVSDVAAEKHLFKANTSATTKYTPIEGGLSAIKKANFDVESFFGKGAKKEDVIRAAELHAAKLHDEMRQWFSTPEGEKATFDQANTHRQQLERPYVMDAVRQSLAHKPDAYPTTKEAIDALPPGAPFSWKGKRGIKK